MYAQLNTKTVFSFMDATVKLTDYITAAKALGYQTLGISDSDNLHAAHQFITQAQAAGIQPVIGYETTLLLDGLAINFTFIAKTNVGLRNLYSISSKKNFGFNDFSDMQSHLSDVALIIPADSAVDSILSQLPPKDVYVGLAQPMAQGFLRPKIPFLTVRYLNAGDAETLAILHHIKNGTKYDDSLTSNHFENLRAESDVRALFDTESLKNLERLVSEISYDIAFDTLALPRFNPEKPAADELRETAEHFLKARQLTSANYQQRLDHELGVIHEMGFDDYFLIVADVIRYARSQ